MNPRTANARDRPHSARATLHERKHLFGELFAHTAVEVERPAANLKYRSVVREDGWKLIWPHRANDEVTLMIRGQMADWMGDEPELFNVRDDPHETKDLAAEHPEIVDELKRQIDAWWTPR